MKLCTKLTALTVVVSALFLACGIGVPIARAEESSGLVWADALTKWRSDIAQLNIRIRDYPLKPRYCRPSHRNDKTFDEVGLRQLEEELGMLVAEFERIMAGTIASTQGSSGGSLTTDRLMSSSYPKYRGHDVTDARHWTMMRRDHIGEAQRLMRGKKDKLAKAPEDYCGTPETSREREAVAVNPPVAPVDTQVSAPTFLPVHVPARPQRFCSHDEKSAWLAALTKLRFDMIENERRADEWANALRAAAARNTSNAARFNQQRTEAEAKRSLYLDMYRQAERLFVDVRDNMMPEKCGGQTGTEVGALPGGSGLYVQGGGEVGEVSIPRKPYLALEGAGGLRLGVVDTITDENATALMLGAGFIFTSFPKTDLLGGFGFPDPLVQKMRLHGSLLSSELSIRGELAPIETSTEGVGIPGTGDPSHGSGAGYFLGDPAFNDVEDIRQTHDSKYDAYSLSLSQDSFRGSWKDSLTLGLRYVRLETRDQLMGSIPGYARDFAYKTDLETAAWGLFLAAEGEVPLGSGWGEEVDNTLLRYAGEFSGFRIAGGVRLGVDSVSTEGTDRLTFTGFDPQSVRVEHDDVTFNYQISAEVRYSPPGVRGLDLSAGLYYSEEDIHPVPHRSGETGDQTQIEYEGQERTMGTLRTTFRF